MGKIANYIKNGRGNGLLFILAAAVLMTMIFMFEVKDIYKEVEPQIIKAAEDILPVTVENGKIVNPVDVYKQTAIQIGEENGLKALFPIVLDTREEVSQVPTEKSGLFIMRDIVYVVSENKIERMQLQDGVLDVAKAQEYLDYFMGLMSVISSLVCVLVLYIVVLVRALITAGCGVLSLKAMKKPELFSFSALMRASAIFVATVEIICFILSSAGGLALSGFSKLFLEILFMWLYLSKEVKTEE